MKAIVRTVGVAAAVALTGYWVGIEAAAADEQAMRLAQAAGGPSAGGGYDPMTAPINPMMPGMPDSARSGPEVGLDPELGDLPDTPGIEDTFYLCSACHSLSIIRQQRISDARWDYLWTWMVEKQGMPEQYPETKGRILSCLKRHFSSER